MRTLLVEPPLTAGEVQVTGREARHGAAVLRLATGDRIRLCDGRGREAPATVTAVARDRLTCRCGKPIAAAPAPAEQLAVAVAPPKGKRFAGLVRQLTELGAGAIHPLATRRAGRAPDLGRLRRVAAEAGKQCGRVNLPRIGPVLDIAALLARPERCILCTLDGGPPRPQPVRPTVLVVGPEGGLDEEEREMLVEAGAEGVRLARTVLRIETAAVVAATLWLNGWENG